MKLTREELLELSKIRPHRTWLTIAWMYALIAGTLAAALLWPHPLVLVAAFILMARHQKALATLAHDGAHRRLFNSRPLNDWVTQHLLSSPVHLFADGYRRTHMRHHRTPLAPDDPDIGITGGYPVPPVSFLRKLLRDATGITYVKFVRHFIRPHKRTKSQAKLDEPAERAIPVWASATSMLSWNALILGALTWAGHPLYYLIFWLLPQVTALQILLRIRGIAEHAGLQQSEDQAKCTRTVQSRVQAWFFAPNSINFHIEHHLYPGIPCYNLARVHRLLSSRGALPPGNVLRGYDDVVRELVKSGRSAPETAT